MEVERPGGRPVGQRPVRVKAAPRQYRKRGSVEMT